jgi:hypothetical protein
VVGVHVRLNLEDKARHLRTRPGPTWVSAPPFSRRDLLWAAGRRRPSPPSS